ncbi:hypothetical protein RHMOL_Rhmol08G0228500 [Rhododendron molle]|uniref:Uncharacterized protein n=1 Tax=Rhododendron molle TaxID=49168 RepID=A0ACC0MSM1_RHOML|nr:hypothetical protein RHMOL_Rhmol08G0228500 [Rhododendron molle]
MIHKAREGEEGREMRAPSKPVFVSRHFWCNFVKKKTSGCAVVGEEKGEFQVAGEELKSSRTPKKRQVAGDGIESLISHVYLNGLVRNHTIFFSSLTDKRDNPLFSFQKF